MITCPDCKEEKPDSDYYVDKDAPYGLSWYCKPCKRKRTNAYRAASRAHYNAINRRAYRMRKKLKRNNISTDIPALTPDVPASG